MDKLHNLLNKSVANFAVLFTKLHHFHWYVKGHQFFTLHTKFESLYDEVNELYDEFAERLLTIGGNVLSNLKSYLEVTSLKETSETKPDLMVKELIEDLTLISIELKELTTLAQDLLDEQTADLAISTTSVLEKHVWMLKSFLG